MNKLTLLGSHHVRVSNSYFPRSARAMRLLRWYEGRENGRVVTPTTARGKKDGEMTVKDGETVW
jgi:hypothetical protein